MVVRLGEIRDGKGAVAIGGGEKAVFARREPGCPLDLKLAGLAPVSNQ
jgi:hypothetical protein